MRILAPYVSLHPDTDLALTAHAKGAQRWRLGASPDAYFWRWANEWDVARRHGHDFMVIEQDIVIHGGVVPAFATCPEPWCVFPFPGPAGVMLTRSLGCVRWPHRMLAAEPDLPDVVGAIDDGDGVGPRDWRRLDVRIATELERRGYTPHAHEPQVEHRHHYEPENRPCMCGACPD